MPAPIVRRAQFAVFVEVRDVADLRMRQASPLGARRRSADFERAEARREIAQPRIVETLRAEDEHGVLVDRPPDRLDQPCVDRRAEVDPARFGGEQRMQRVPFEAHVMSPYGDCAPSTRSGNWLGSEDEGCKDAVRASTRPLRGLLSMS